MQYVQNVAIGCNFCGAHIAQGRERSTPMRNGDTLLECVWTCPQCGQCARRDEQVVKKPVVEKKLEKLDEQKKQKQ